MSGMAGTRWTWSCRPRKARRSGCTNHTAPWWDTGYARVRKLGMKLILGSWAGGILGGQPELDVSAAQWIYDAAITHDGYWMWTSRKWGPQDYAIHRTATRRIRATEGKVGDFLFKGTQDTTFVTAVEQSGDPVLGRNVMARTYHLGERHLVHINNVNTDRSVSVLIRFSRLESDGRWTVSDAMTDLYYAHDLSEAIWSDQDCAAVNWPPSSNRSIAIGPSVCCSSREISGGVSGSEPRRHCRNIHLARPDTSGSGCRAASWT